MRARIVLAAAVALVPLGLLGLGSSDDSFYPGPFDRSRLAGDVPEPMLSAYLGAASQWVVDWALLAAIGKLECDHGRSREPGCWPPGTVNHAGARGPMQFLGSTWRAEADRYDLEVAGPPVADGYGYATDGDGDGIADPWNVYDAAHAAARYLVDLGGRDNPRLAAKRYNAGPANPDPAAGEAYAARAVELIAHYHAIAGVGGPGASAVAVAPGGGGCTVPDPTGTGGCVTPRAAHLVAELERAFGPLPLWCWAPRPGNPTSDHPHGRACDLTVGQIGRHPTSNERAHGWVIADWVTANAAPLGITYVIWDGQIWTPRTGWRPYRSRVYDVTTPTGGHFDHLHISVKR